MIYRPSIKEFSSEVQKFDTFTAQELKIEKLEYKFRF
jgi:wobble nucleotide-excising tRNase